MKHWFCNMFRT